MRACILLAGITVCPSVIAAQAIHLEFEGTPEFGRAIAGLGDLDGDGRPEFVVGDADGAMGRGEVFVRSGRTGEVVFLRRGLAGERLGYDVANVGDVNADGFDDIGAIAHGWADPSAPTTPVGVTRIFSGSDGSQLHEFRGNPFHDGRHELVRPAGDVNADGHADVLVTQPEGDPLGTGGQRKGIVQAFSGRDGSLLHEFVGAPFSQAGYSALGIGDIDGDGHDDLAIARRHPAGEGANQRAGQVLVHSGATGAVILRAEGGVLPARRHAIDRLGDVDGDGASDLFIAAVLRANTQTQPHFGGSGRVVSGATGEILIDGLPGAGPFSQATAIGDLDGDGFTDFADAGPSGRVVSGAPGDGDPELLTLFEGCTTVSKLGDVNGDGRVDWLAAWSYGHVSGAPPGRAFVILGSCELPRLECAGPGNMRLHVLGSPSLSSETLGLRVTGGAAGAVGLWLVGEQAGGAFDPAGICVSGSVVRLPERSSLDSLGAAERRFDGQDPFFAAGGLLPGTSPVFQFWHHPIPGEPIGRNVSRAVRVPLCP